MIGSLAPARGKHGKKKRTIRLAHSSSSGSCASPYRESRRSVERKRSIPRSLPLGYLRAPLTCVCVYLCRGTLLLLLLCMARSTVKLPIPEAARTRRKLYTFLPAGYTSYIPTPGVRARNLMNAGRAFNEHPHVISRALGFP